MSDNAEEGIARAQASAARAQGNGGNQLRTHQNRGIAYLDERILTYILAIGLFGLAVLWAVSTSPMVIYGSFAGGILCIMLWGGLRIRRIKRLRRQRQQQAEQWRSQR